MKTKKPKQPTEVALYSDWGKREIEGKMNEEDFDLLWDLLTIIWKTSSETQFDDRKALKLIRQVVFDRNMTIKNY